jgi:hypothetical protein
VSLAPLINSAVGDFDRPEGVTIWVWVIVESSLPFARNNQLVSGTNNAGFVQPIAVHERFNRDVKLY